jgi:hypothetical protein
MRTTKATIFALVIGGVFVACGGGSGAVGAPGDGGTGDGQTEKDNPPECPKAVTNQGAKCTREGLVCVYGSGCSYVRATCAGGVFAIETTNCPVEGNACAAAGGQCQCGEKSEPCSLPGYVRDVGRSCPQGPPNSGVCSMTCCVPGPSDAGAEGG